MEESTIIIDDSAIARGQVESVLETTLREGARRRRQEALKLEVEEYSQRFQELRDDQGQRMVVRNGYHQERELVTGVGKVSVRQRGSTTGARMSTSPVPSCRRIFGARRASTP